MKIGDEYIKLPRSRVLKIGVLSIDFRDGGGALGFESHCCKGDLADCVKKTGPCPEDRPITVFK